MDFIFPSYSSLSNTTVALPLSAGKIMIVLSLIALKSDFVILGGGVLALFNIPSLSGSFS